jgi:hypothetical protein
MAYHADSSEARELRASGLGLILYSVVFVALLAYGWNFIIGGFLHPAISWLGALVMALLAWVLAKIIGGSERGIRGNKALFTALLILSAVGVFNTLMIRLEGKAIFGETIDVATRQYSLLPEIARASTDNKEVAALRKRIDALRTQLAQEIMNPRNCGEGPEATKLLAQIRQELPGFVKYSGTSRDCDNNEQLIGMYDKQIDKLLYGTDVFINANVESLESLRRRIDAEVPRELAKLDQLRKEVNSGASLIGYVRPKLEESSSAYQALTLALTSAVPSLRTGKSLPLELDVGNVRNLGEWGHLVPLLMSRLDRPQTWVYLLLSIFLDWLLVHLFARIAGLRRAMPRKLVAGGTPTSLETPW